jgi:hypothetical protein
MLDYGSDVLLQAVGSNQPMKPTAPLRNKFRVIATTPAVAYLFLVRQQATMLASW